MSEETPPKWTMPPQIKQGHRVYVGKHPAQLDSNQKRLVGWITKMGPEYVEVVTFGPGQYLGQAWTCLHISNPLVRLNPGLLQDNNYAVFEWAEKELSGRDDGRAQAGYELWKKVEAELNVAQKRLDLLENKLELLQQPRKRGRPPGKPTPQIPVSSDV